MCVQYLGEHAPISRFMLPMQVERVSAGFPSPAQDYVENRLDLNELCVPHPSATYLVKALGDSMLEAGIHPGDILIVDRSIQARHGHVVIAELRGELTVKRLELKPCVRLVPCNPKYQPIELSGEDELCLMGVVIRSIRDHCQGQGVA